jgi:hypothetical protein|nr:MAG TPA: hypothetical protein [Bacteriophage sp.]
MEIIMAKKTPSINRFLRQIRHWAYGKTVVLKSNIGKLEAEWIDMYEHSSDKNTDESLRSLGFTKIYVCDTSLPFGQNVTVYKLEDGKYVHKGTIFDPYFEVI